MAGSFRPSSNLAEFKAKVDAARHVVFLTGAGISAESGIPTFRGAGGFWRKYQCQELACLEAFNENPSLVWEFYHYRREVVFKASPNPGHKAIADFQEKIRKRGGDAIVITQNIDGLHARAGTKDVIELHGSLFLTRCMKCGHEERNDKSPICEALRGKGELDVTNPANIPINELPSCSQPNCGGLTRPAVVWFGENLDMNVLSETMRHLQLCDLCLVVGTSSVVYPAAGFARKVAARGVPVAEFNLEVTPSNDYIQFYFEGKSGEWLPKALG